ncbi:hypothetical protein [Iodobacter ciconiae]|uniref:Uncharacterized protein n=1 Tax=Iodobacter ciconiae TaxID=2496266 RepID=A0A3S8ZNH7_9NEIS|nr:hypothetical protein [Iodobacter ciconiae]AZN35045.1 hypothetical protein EJO50_00210 [Iodobacter ciconiae]
MALLFFGSLLIVLGLLAGCLLLIAPLGIIEINPGIGLWLLFPIFSIGGYILLILTPNFTRLRLLALFLSSLLLLLAATAATELMLYASTLLQPAGSTLILWYVLIIAGGLGVVVTGAFDIKKFIAKIRRTKAGPPPQPDPPVKPKH